MTYSGSINWLKSSQALAGACAALLLSSCGSGGGSSSALNLSANPTASAATRVSLAGVLHGGQAPIVGSSLTLYAAGVPASAPPSMLGTSTTEANGNFNIAYTCPTASTLVYVVAAGGNSGGGTNSAIKLMAALGPCGTSPSSIVINELTTVAAVYALNAFSNVPPTSVTGLGGCVDCVPVVQADMTQLHGNSPAINNAFETAALLTDVGSGQPARSLPPGAACTAAGTQANCNALRKMNKLGNILGSCVNSAGVSSVQCTALFDCTVPNALPFTTAIDCSVPTGATISTDTLQAALSLARNQGVVGLTALDALAGRNVLFSPVSAGLNEATIALNFSGGGLNEPLAIAVDSLGNLWTANFANFASGSVSEFNSSGIPLSPAAGFTGGGLDTPSGIAIDAAGNVWVANFHSTGVTSLGNGGVSELNPSGTPISGPNGFSGSWATNPFGIAIDPAGNIWTVNDGNGDVNELDPEGTVLSGNGFAGAGLPNSHVGIAIDDDGNVWTTNFSNNNSLSELNSSGVPISPATGFTGGGLNVPQGIAVDSAGNVWAANSGSNSVSEFSSGQPLSSGTGFTGGGLNAPSAMAIDGADHIWVTNPAVNSITELNSSGAVLSPFGFTGRAGTSSVAILDAPLALAIDGAGDVWVANAVSNSLTEFIGAAAPTVTPLVAQISKPLSPLLSIAVTPTAAAITDGSTQQFTATGTYADASVRNISASVTWTSSNTSIATIAAGGLATCMAPGGVDITANMTQDGAAITGTATQALTCSAAVVSGLSCFPAPANAGGGDFPYENQSYCATFSGNTSAGYNFTGTLTFTTALTWPNPGSVVACQYASTGTFNGAPASTTAATCSGSFDENGGLTVSDPNFTAFRFLGTFSGTNDSVVSGDYTFITAFGPGAGTVSGTFTGTVQ